MATTSPAAFVSYSRSDSDFAMQLVSDLKEAGAQVWLDQLDIEPGMPWDRAVEDALANSPHMLVILSSVSVNSDNVRDEVSYALMQQKRVIPVLYRDCNVPFRLARLQHIDFRTDYAHALKALLRSLGVDHVALDKGVVHDLPLSSPALSTAVDAPQNGEIESPHSAHEEQLAQQARQEEERKQRVHTEAVRAAALEAQFAAAEQERQQAELVQQLARQAREDAERGQREQAETLRLAELERQRVPAAQLARSAPPPPPSPPAPVHVSPARPAPHAENVPQPRTRTTPSPRPVWMQIALYSVVTGFLRAITYTVSLLVEFLVHISIWVGPIFVAWISGYIIARALLGFKPQLSRAQVAPIIRIWALTGLATAGLALLRVTELLGFTVGGLILSLPLAVAGALTGWTLAGALHKTPRNGLVAGFVAFAIPGVMSRFILHALLNGHFPYSDFAIVSFVLDICFESIEVGLLLWFIRDWGPASSPQPNPS